ncbi:MAG: site-specific integrase [Pelagibacterales bacterium]|nr:site-specific integrase [Pelagibacterales bacterium]
MNTEKLEHKLEQGEIKQTRTPLGPIRFKDEAINKINKRNIIFGKKPHLFIPFIVSKDSHQKGLKLRVYKGAVGDKGTLKVFYLQFWFNGKADIHKIGKYSQRFGTKECDEYLVDLVKTHTDNKTGFWLKDPNITRRDEQRIVEKPDTTQPKGFTINETIEAYCGAEIPGEEIERGFSKDRKDGFRAAKSCRSWFRYMAGYNHRQSLVDFDEDEDGYGIHIFKLNKHLRINKPTSWRDLFRKYPPGRGILKDRQYWNRRKKQTYTIPASKNKSIYDSDLGKSLLSDLKTGDIEAWIKNLSSMEVKREYVKVFVTLWIFARKKGWLGTNPGDCPFIDKVYIKKERQKEDPYKNIAINQSEFRLFWECSEELSKQFPWKSELHQFMILTALRKQEALKVQKSFIDWKEGIINIPKGIEKNRKHDQTIIITPELEVLLHNILDIGKRPGLDFYNMKDFPWVFATRRWGSYRYFNKEFRLSSKTRLGGDENYVPILRALMRAKSGDPELLYSSKVLRKTYITLSKQRNDGRSDKVKHLSRHSSEQILEAHYDKPSIDTIRGYAEKTSEVFNFIQRRSA